MLLAAAIGCAEDLDLPDVLLLISVDTLNADALPSNDAERKRLPNLHALMQRSLQFENAISTSSWTLPAHASLMTGLYADRHGATARSVRLAPEVSTLAEQLADHGFETVAFTGGGFLDTTYGLGDGFERYNDRLSEGELGSNVSLSRDGRTGDRNTLTLFDRAIEFLEQRQPGDRPLFLFLQTFLVHDYFMVHDWNRGAVSPPVHDREYYGKCLRGYERCTDKDWSTLRTLYDAEVETLDEGLGFLLSTLEGTGLERRALVLFTSDHGEGFDIGRRRIHHGGRLHADLLRVPLLISGPAIESGLSDRSISLVDILPTLLDRFGIRIPSGLDGVSFNDVLAVEPGSARSDSAEASRPLLASDYYYGWANGVRKQARKPRSVPISVAVIQGSRWYVEGAEGEQFYDLDNDLRQARNMAGLTDDLDDLRKIASEHRNRATPPLHPIEEDADLQSQLEALGYVEHVR